MIEISIERKLTGADGPLNLRIKTTIQKGEFVTLYGASGAGKTSILRILAGLLDPQHGFIQVNKRAWFDSSNKINVKPQFRNIGIVFQDYTLFPNMTVRGNLEFALSKGQSAAIIDEMIQFMELGNLSDKRPNILSGGQKQRVALARALVRQPQILLLDEPLSALDTQMQEKLQDYILELHSKFNLTTIMVSHDLAEVIKMSQRVLVLEDGEIKKDGTPLQVLPLNNLKQILSRFS